MFGLEVGGRFDRQAVALLRRLARSRPGSGPVGAGRSNRRAHAPLDPLAALAALRADAQSLLELPIRPCDASDGAEAQSCRSESSWRSRRRSPSSADAQAHQSETGAPKKNKKWSAESRKYGPHGMGLVPHIFFPRSRQMCTRRSRAAHHDGRAPRSAQREAARASGLRERQHMVQARFAGSGAFGDQPRRSQGRAANGVLHCSRQHAPPPACPGSGGSSSEGWWHTESPDPDELSDTRLRVGVPAPSDVNSKDEEAVAAAALQLRVGCALAALGNAQGDAWSMLRSWVRGARSGDRADQRGIATQGEAQRRCAVHH